MPGSTRSLLAQGVKTVSHPVQPGEALFEEGAGDCFVARRKGFELGFAPGELTPESRDWLKRSLGGVSRELQDRN